MNKLNIGCADNSNMVTFLNEKFNIVKPYIYYKNKKIIRNFDILLNFDGVPDADENYISNNLDVPVIGTYRYGKSRQMMTLDRLGINHPYTYFSIRSSRGQRLDYAHLLLNNIINEDSELIIKSENGARGIGQILIKKKEIYDLFDDMRNSHKSNKDLLDKYTFGGISEDYKKVLESAEDKNSDDIDINPVQFIKNDIINGNFHIQVKEKIVDEYRVIYSYDEKPIIYKRTRSDKNWQGNTSLNDLGVFEEFNFLNSKHQNIKNISDKLGNYLNVPWLSIDFYIDKYDNMGIIEYQMQLGYRDIPKNLLLTHIISGFQKKVKSVLNK